MPCTLKYIGNIGYSYVDGIVNYLSITLQAGEPCLEDCPSLVRMGGEKTNLEPWATLYICQCSQRMRQRNYLLVGEIRSKALQLLTSSPVSSS